jgi:hypothetical protein
MYTLGYTGSTVNDTVVYKGANETEVAAIKALAALVGLQQEVIDAVLVAAVNRLLAASYTATDIANNMEAISAAAREKAGTPAEAKKGLPKWAWIGIIVGGIAAVAGTVTVFVRRKKG